MLSRIKRTDFVEQRRSELEQAYLDLRCNPQFLKVDPQDDIICDLCSSDCDDEMVFVDTTNRMALCNRCASRFT